MRRCKGNTHAENDVQVAGDAHTRDFDSYSAPFVCTPQYIGVAPAFNFHRTFRTIWDANGLWDHAALTTRFVELVKQLQSFLIRYGRILGPQKFALVLEESENVEELTLSVSLTRLPIYGPESR